MPKIAKAYKQDQTSSDKGEPETLYFLIFAPYLSPPISTWDSYNLCRGHAKHRRRQALWSGIEPKGGSNTFHPLGSLGMPCISKSNTEANTELSVHTLNFFALNWGLLTVGYCSGFCLHRFGASIQRSALCCSCLQPYNMKHQDRVCDNSFSYNSDINLSKLPMRDCAWFVDASRSAIAMVHAPNSTEMLVKLRCPGNSLKWMCHAINCDMLQYVSICYHAKVIPCLSRFKQAIAPLLLRVNTASSRPETRRLPLTVFGVSKAVPCRRRSLSIWHLFLPPESGEHTILVFVFFVSCLSIAWKKVFHKIFWSIWWA